MMDYYENLTDEELVALAKCNDESALEIIFHRYKRIVREKARIYFIMGGDPDDIIQEGMIGLFRAVRSFNEEKAVGFNYFAQLCIEAQIKTAIKQAASKKNSPLNSSVSIPEEEDPAFVDLESPESILVDKEHTKGMVARLRGRLSEYEERVFDMMLMGKGLDQMAQELGEEKKSVDNAIQRIKRKMRELK